MTTKRQAEICVERNLSDQEIVDMTGCHPECVEYVRAWGRGERVEELMCKPGGAQEEWWPVPGTVDRPFSYAESYRIAPRRIHVTATMPDGVVREASFPEPLGGLGYHEKYWASFGDMTPVPLAWICDSYDLKYLRLRWIFRTPEDALERDKAMIYISGGEVE